MFIVIFTVRVKIHIEYRETFTLAVSFLGIKIKILPKKPKKYKLGYYTPKKILKRQQIAEKKAAKKAEKERLAAIKKAEKKKKKAEEDAAMTPEEKRARKASRPSIVAIIRLAARLVKILIPRFFKHIHVEVLRIRIIFGSSDAATTAVMYGAAYGAVESILSVLKKITHLHSLRHSDIHLEPDFTSDTVDAEIKMVFLLRIGAILGLLIKVGFKALVGWIKIQPPKPDEPAKKKPVNKNKSAQTSTPQKNLPKNSVKDTASSR